MTGNVKGRRISETDMLAFVPSCTACDADFLLMIWTIAWIQPAPVKKVAPPKPAVRYVGRCVALTLTGTLNLTQAVMYNPT